MDFIRSHVGWLEPTFGAYTASLVIAIITLAYFYYQNQFQYFKRMGLKNPKPLPVLGNMLPMLRNNRMENEQKWLRNHGKFYGIFQGVRPRFVVADPEVLRQICIKDFDVFPNHEKSELLNKYQQRFIFFAQDDHWRRMRALQTPTFTSGKIKRMYKLLDQCANDLVCCFGEQLEMATTVEAKHSGAVVNVKEIYSLFTMDAIASCGYGLKLDRARGSASIKSVANRDNFVALAMRLFEFKLARILVVFSFPKKLLSFLGFYMTPVDRIEPLAEKVRHIIKSRRRQLADSKKFDDYLQLLLDAKLDDRMELNEMDTKENHHAGLTHESLLKDQEQMVSKVEASGEVEKSGGGNGNQNGSTMTTQSLSKAALSEEDILTSAIFLLVVGLETTATLLCNCTYALAFHPEIQDKLHEEVSKIAELNETKTGYVFDYEALTSCQYLDAVISETLRALSPVLTLDRVAKEDYYVEKYNVTIPRDAKVLLAFHAAMNDAENWPEPRRFNPERFMPGQREKIVPGSYCPFGLGPRHCLGMRFSLTEAKLGLAKVIMRYKFESAPETTYPPRSKPGMGLNSLEKPLVTLKLRNS